jgi:hypothetical protein
MTILGIFQPNSLYIGVFGEGKILESPRGVEFFE